MKTKFTSLKTRLIVHFSVVILVGAVLYVTFGVRLIGTTVIRQAQDKVRLDLNTAREVYRGEITALKQTVRLTAERFFLRDSIQRGERNALIAELERIRQRESLDMFTLTDGEGRVIVNARRPCVYGDRLDRDTVEWVRARKTVAASTQIIPGDVLEKEGNAIAEQARVKVIDTPRAYPRPPSAPDEERAGMAIGSAAPVFNRSGTIIGVLCGEKLLNRSCKIVDKVKEIVFKGEKHKGKDIGTVTVFLKDLRISTNVSTSGGKRAVGTRVSRDVYNRVLVEGLPWTGRAFVVTDWYITAYEPLRNLAGEIVGMLYVGVLEAPYIDLRNRVIFYFFGITLLCVALLIGTAYFTAARTTRPLNALTRAAGKVANGDLAYRVPVESEDETGQLSDAFNRMTADLEKMTAGYRELNRTLENRVKEKTGELEEARDRLVQSETLSALGKMAAGVAHEINNPLTSILINAHLLKEELNAETRFTENLKIIVEETARCASIVKDLLAFSRQTPPRIVSGDIRPVVEKAVLLLKNQASLQKVTVFSESAAGLPNVKMDAGKIAQVFTNVILNALDAMPRGGGLFIRTGLAADRLITVTFRDEGCGIPAKVLTKVFDPFFTTKGVKGTGLGLSVSYGIVEQHGGRMDIRSEEGKGTTITVYLPVDTGRKIKIVK